MVVMAIMIPIALLHFVTGSNYEGPFPLFVNSYLMDILVPFGFYFLLCLSEAVLFESWLAKGLAVFMAATAVELAQYRGVELLGSTYDPLDILMYGLGVGLALLLDQLVLPHLFSFWRPGSASGKEREDIFVWHQR